MYRQQIGKMGERAVVTVLQRKGFRIIGSNIYTRWGEVDILAECKGVVHVIEVKTRRSEQFGLPEEAVDLRKLRRMRKTIWAVQQEYHVRGQKIEYAIAAVLLKGGTAHIRFIWNIGFDDIGVGGPGV